mgnify:CR=1 FL=1
MTVITIPDDLKAAIDSAFPNEKIDAVVERLIREADVFITGQVGPIPAKLGMDYESVRAINPRIVYCQTTGFGAVGPYAEIPTHGQMMEKLGGAPSLELAANGRIIETAEGVAASGVSLGPIYSAYAIAAAIIRRDRTGEGCYIDVSCSDAVVTREGQRKAPWRARKEAYIAKIRTKSRGTLLVSCADKLHNARSIMFDHDRIGDAVGGDHAGDLDGRGGDHLDVDLLLPEDAEDLGGDAGVAAHTGTDDRDLADPLVGEDLVGALAGRLDRLDRLGEVVAGDGEGEVGAVLGGDGLVLDDHVDVHVRLRERGEDPARHAGLVLDPREGHARLLVGVRHCCH